MLSCHNGRTAAGSGIIQGLIDDLRSDAGDTKKPIHVIGFFDGACAQCAFGCYQRLPRTGAVRALRSLECSTTISQPCSLSQSPNTKRYRHVFDGEVMDLGRWVAMDHDVHPCLHRGHDFCAGHIHDGFGLAGVGIPRLHTQPSPTLAAAPAAWPGSAPATQVADWARNAM